MGDVAAAVVESEREKGEEGRGGEDKEGKVEGEKKSEEKGEDIVEGKRWASCYWIFFSSTDLFLRNFSLFFSSPFIFLISFFPHFFCSDFFTLSNLFLKKLKTKK